MNLRGERCPTPTRSPGPDLVLPVVLLRVPQDAVAEAADVSEGRVPLVPELLQPQHRAVPAVRERGLQQLEDLRAERESRNVIARV